MELKAIRLTIPENGNIIVGQSHFIKTVEDIYEAMVNTSPHLQFGVAFNEASGECLTRFDGNEESLKRMRWTMRRRSARDTSSWFRLRNGFPINVLGRIREVPEVVTIFCATANPVEVIVAETEQGPRYFRRDRWEFPRWGGDRNACQSAGRTVAEVWV